MNASSSAVEHYVQLAEQARRRRGSETVDGLEKKSDDALAHFTAQGFPTRKQEAWRYTSLDQLLAHPFVINESSVAAPPHDHISQLHITQQAVARLVFCDGRYMEAHSQTHRLPPGVTVRSLRSARKTDAERLARYMGSTLEGRTDAFDNINTALVDDGFFIELSAGTTLDAPIEVIYTSTQDNSEQLLPLRNLILMQAGSQISLIEHFSSQDDAPNFTNSVIEAVLAENSRLGHYRLQNEGLHCFHKSTVSVRQAASSDYRGTDIAVGGRWSRTDYRVRLSGRDASCQLKGLYVTDNNQLKDYHLDIDHQVPACRSDEHFKGILSGEGRAVFDGRVKVSVDAQKSEAHLKNDNLLLSRNAEIDTKPLLEIYADDVQCSHGTTVGQIEDEQLYYLRSRGIDEHLARRMLCNGFAQDILLDCADAAFRNYAATVVESRL